MKIDNFQKENTIAGDSAEDTNALRAMAKNARRYLSSFEWCPAIKNLYLAFGVGGVVAVFVAELSENIQGSSDSWLWVIEGDLPSAYMVVENIQDPKTAVEVYCDLMDDWAKAVIANQGVEDVFPVRAKPTCENADSLLRRTKFIREIIVPQIELAQK